MHRITALQCSWEVSVTHWMHEGKGHGGNLMCFHAVFPLVLGQAMA